MTISDYLNNFLLGYLPYIALGVFVTGFIYRIRHRNNTIQATSSQFISNDTSIRLGSPLFHYAIILVFLGHIFGLLTPEWLYHCRISGYYHTHLASVYEYTGTSHRTDTGLYHCGSPALSNLTGFVGNLHYHSISLGGLYGDGTLGTGYCYIRTRFMEIYSLSELGVQTAYYQWVSYLHYFPVHQTNAHGDGSG